MSRNKARQTNYFRHKKVQKEQEGTKIYLTPNSTLQTPAEHRHDQSVDPRRDNTIAVSKDDLRETDVDRMREDLDGTRGTSERSS